MKKKTEITFHLKYYIRYSKHPVNVSPGERDTLLLSIHKEDLAVDPADKDRYLFEIAGGSLK